LLEIATEKIMVIIEQVSVQNLDGYSEQLLKKIDSSS